MTQGPGTSHDRDSAVRGSLWGAAQALFPMLGTAALSIAMGRVLGPDDLGLQSWIAYVHSLLWAVLVWPLVLAGIQTLSVARGATDDVLTARLALWTIRLIPGMGLASAAFLLGMGVADDQVGLWALAAGTAIANSTAWAVAIRLISRSGWARVSRLHTITLLAAQLAGIVAVLAGLGIAGVLAATLIEALVFAASMRSMSRERFTGPRGSLPRALRRFWPQQLAQNGLQEIVGQRIEFLFLGVLSTPDQLAMYSIPFMIVSAVAAVPQALIRAGLPAMAARSAAGDIGLVRQHLASACRVTLAVGGPLAAGTAAAGPAAVQILYGPQFLAASQLVPAMSLLLLVVPVSTILQTYWASQGTLRAVLWALVIGGVVDLLLAWWLIPGQGSTGAVIANVVAQALTALLVLVQSRRALPELRLAGNRALRNLAVSLLLAAPTVALVLSGSDTITITVAAAATVLALVAVGAFWGYLSPADAAWARAMLPARMAPLLRLIGGRGANRGLPADS